MLYVIGESTILHSSIHHLLSHMVMPWKWMFLKFTFWYVHIFVLSSCLTYVTVLLWTALPWRSHFGFGATHLTCRYISQCHWLLWVLMSTGSRAKTRFSFFWWFPFIVDLESYCRQATVKGLLLSITSLSLSKRARTLCVKASVYHTAAAFFVSANQKKWLTEGFFCHNNHNRKETRNVFWEK